MSEPSGSVGQSVSGAYSADIPATTETYGTGAYASDAYPTDTYVTEAADVESTSTTDAAKEAAGQTASTAKEQAAGVGQAAAQAGSQVASTAKEQGQQVVAEAASQARDLLGEARSQAQTQAGTQKDKAVTGVRGIASELEALVNGEGGQSGMVTEFARQATTRLQEIAQWVESREPGDLLDEAKGFARRKPGTFLLGAAVAGLLAGRMTRGTIAAVHESSEPDAAPVSYASTPAYAPVGTYATESYPTGTYPTETYPADTYAADSGYAAPDTHAGTAGYETVDVRSETTGVGYGARP